MAKETSSVSEFLLRPSSRCLLGFPLRRWGIQPWGAEECRSWGYQPDPLYSLIVAKEAPPPTLRPKAGEWGFGECRKVNLNPIIYP